jgi:hypothetical protein
MVVDAGVWASAHLASGTRLDITGDPARDFVEVRDGYYVPRRYRIDVDDPRLPCEIILDVFIDDAATPHCREVQFLARAGEADIGWDQLRIPLRTLLDRTLVAWAGPLKVVEGELEGKRVSTLQLSFGARDAQQVAAITIDLRDRRPRPGGRRKRVTPDHLRDVARLYREAIKSSEPGIRSRPRKYIREQLAARNEFYSADTIAKWVSTARERGFLEEAPGAGKAGVVSKRRKR